MNAVIARVMGEQNPEQGDYDNLPTAVRQYYTPRQWQFLSDAQKANLIREETEPEC